MHTIGNIKIFIEKSAGDVVPTGEKGMEANEPEPVFSDADINWGKFLDAAFHPRSGDRLDHPLLTYNPKTMHYTKEDISSRFSGGLQNGWGGGETRVGGAESVEEKGMVLERIGDGKPHTAQELRHCLPDSFPRWAFNPWNGKPILWPENEIHERQKNVENGA